MMKRAEVRLTELKRLLDAAVTERVSGRLPEPHEGSPLYVGMMHAVAAGKRLRGALVLESARFAAGNEAAALSAAIAIEMLHAYSLVHDDLPAMDDAELRRGRPTVHRVVGEGMAVLVGDALLTDAFALLLEAPDMTPAQALAVARHLAEGAGLAGMVRGQELDLLYERKPIDAATLERLHRMKTGALLRAACRMGLALGTAEVEARARFDAYGAALGLAFQVRDDLLDLDAAADTGKDSQHDAALGKATYPALYGEAASRAQLTRLLDDACAALAPYGERAAFFLDLAHDLRLPA